MSSLRTWVAWSVIAAALLVSPVLVFLMVIAAEMLIDGLMQAGVTGVCAVAAGAIGWALVRRISRPLAIVRQPVAERIFDEGAIALPPT